MKTVSGKTNAVGHSSSAVEQEPEVAPEVAPEVTPEAMLSPEMALGVEALLGRGSQPPEYDFFESRTRGWYLCIEFKTI